MTTATHTHTWERAGVNVQGAPHVACRDKHCTAEMALMSPELKLWRPTTGPGMSIDGIALDIEDDPIGGVAKMVCREAAGVYSNLDLQPGDVVLDIGAHVGILSIYLAKRYPGVTVYSYEPNPRNYERLLRNIDVNPHAPSCIIACEAAVTGDSRPVHLEAPTHNSGEGCIYVEGEPTIPSVTLANICAINAIERIALLKIDCEGAEFEILTADESVLDRVTYLRGEFHQQEDYGWDPEALLALCQRHIQRGHIALGVAQV